MLTADHLKAAACKLWGPPTSKSATEWRFGTHGSKSIIFKDLVWHDHETGQGGGVVNLCAMAQLDVSSDYGNTSQNKEKTKETVYRYLDERGVCLFEVVRLPGHKFFQRKPDGTKNIKGVRRVLYRLPHLTNIDTQDQPVFVCEGEKDADNVAALGLIATTNPGGAGKWREEYSEFLRDRDVVILPDNDQPGRDHADMVERMLHGHAKSVRVVKLPGLADKGDVSDWIAPGRTAAMLLELVEATSTREQLPDAVNFEDFLYCSPENKFIYTPTGTLWQAKAVDLRLPHIGGVKPSTFIARGNAVEQMTWSPGEPTLIKHKLVVQGGWIKRPNATVFNHYKAPNVQLGHSDDAAAWVEHVHYVYPSEADHIIKWLAHRCQYPATKINHALVLGGAQGIGKDSILHPVLYACGPWNCESVSPSQVLGRFNGHLKSVILVINEARDLGDVNRPQFYEHLKAVIAAPPDVLLVDEKNTHPYYIPNVTGVIITTNHKAGGIYLTAEDRRHFIAWSPLEIDNIEADYFERLWGFYANGGLRDVASYLRELDVRSFDPKALPPKTPAFWEIVTASATPEVSEIGDALAMRITNPEWAATTTLADLISFTSNTDPDLVMHLRDRKNRRMIARWMEAAGWIAIANPDNKQGLWTIDGKRQVVYGEKSIPYKELLRQCRRRSATTEH